MFFNIYNGFGFQNKLKEHNKIGQKKRREVNKGENSKRRTL